MDLSLIVVTDRRLARRPLLEVVAAALDGGARTFLLREKDLPRTQRLELAEAMRSLRADVIVAGRDPLGGNAIHLSSTDEFADAEIVGRSCHSVEEALRFMIPEVARQSTPQMASGRGFARQLPGSWGRYCTLSPIYETASKPGYGPALGTGVLRKGIVALGGIDSPERAEACRAAGATGVAVMGAVMRADDPATVVKGLLR